MARRAISDFPGVVAHFRIKIRKKTTGKPAKLIKKR
jgi:hypothetical protein